MIYSIGDVNIDAVSTSDADWLYATSRIVECRSRLSLGGTAFNFASAICELGQECALVGRVGCDPAGMLAEALVKQSGLTHFLARDPERPTCIVTILHFEQPGNPRRFMFFEKNNANYGLSTKDIEGLNFQFTENDVVFITGYTVFRDQTRQAAAMVAHLTRTAGARLVLDLVPHDLAFFGDPRELRNQLTEVFPSGLDLMFSEYNTLCYLMDLEPKPTDELNLAIAAKTVCRLSANICIRYGYENCEHEALFKGDALLKTSTTEYKDLPPHMRVGFSEKLSARMVCDLFLK